MIRAVQDLVDEPDEGLRIDFGPLPPRVAAGTWGPHKESCSWTRTLHRTERNTACQQSNNQGRRLTSGPLRWARNEADLSPCTSHQHRRTSQRTGQPVDPRPAPAAHHVAANPTQLGRLTRILRCETGFTPLQNNGSQPWRGNVTSWHHGTVADQRGSRLFVGIVVVQRFRPYKWKAKMSAWLVGDGGGFA